MFDVLDDLETAVDKIAAGEGFVDVERICRLSERLEFQRLRAVGSYDNSCDWATEGFASTASALRSKLRCTPGHASRSVDLARKLVRLPEAAVAFAAGEISREHAAVIAYPYTPQRSEMINNIEAGLVTLAKITTPHELRNELQRYVDAFDGDGGAKKDKREHDKNKITLSATLHGRGILNGSFDAELTEIATTALDAEIALLRERGDTRTMPQLRAEAFESICRYYLAARANSTARGRGQAHLSVVQDIQTMAGMSPELAAVIRAETAHGARLSRATIERMARDCSISRIITDGPSQILDVGRMTRTVSGPLWNALVARDRRCTAAGCDRPPGACEAHHIWHWTHGGPTNLENLRPLCWHHHRRQHMHDAEARAG